MDIKNIIFDFGGVLFAIDYNAPAVGVSHFGWNGFTAEYSKANQNPIYDGLEIGAIDPAHFMNHLYAQMPNASHTSIMEAWNSILLHPISDRIKAIPSIKNAGYRTFLLSNTNAIHVPAFEKMMKENGDYENFIAGFEVIHYSQVLGKRKPHPATFTHLLELHQLKAEETLFIDDSIQHVQGAQAAGLQTLHLTGEMDLLQELRKLKIDF
jgi:putative hydrolase of the HAD superfamily